MERKDLLFKALDSIHQEPNRFDMQGYAFLTYREDLRPVLLDYVETLDLIANPTCDTVMCLAGWVIHHYSQEGGIGVDYLLAREAVKILYGVSEIDPDDKLFSMMRLDDDEYPKTPEELVNELEELGVLEEGEYVYQGAK